MRRPVLVAALAVIAAAALLACHLIAGRATNGSSGVFHSGVVTSTSSAPLNITTNGSLVVYFSAGASPAPLQAIGYVERGQLYSTVTIQGQVVAIGRGLTPELKEALAGLIANSTMKFGSPNAPVVVVEWLDPTCPYCAVFSVDYFNYLLQYINNGTVLYVIRYFPTHVFAYLQPDGYYPQAFNAGVETWLSLECIYKRHGPDAALDAAEGMFKVAAYYLSAYMQTNNSTYLSIYPLEEKRYLDSRYPDCAYNLTLDQAIAVVEQAERQITAEAKALGIPNEMLGTPLFVVSSHAYGLQQGQYASQIYNLTYQEGGAGQSAPRLLSSSSAATQVPVTVQAVDGFGRLRTDWRVIISVGAFKIASGNGQVTANLSYGGTYTVTVITTVKTAGWNFTYWGIVDTAVNVTKITVTGPATYVVKVPSAVISARVVDAFGTALTDADIWIDDYASWLVDSGTGSISTEVLAGEYTVVAWAYGHKWRKSVSVRPGQIVNVQIVVPIAKINAKVIDQAKGTLAPWTVRIVRSGSFLSEASGTGSTSAIVLALDDEGKPLSYTVEASTPFGEFSTGPFTLKPGEIATKTIVVPTAILRISAVDDYGQPIDDLVSQVDIYYTDGTLYKRFAFAPAEVEVLGDRQYVIKVTTQQGHIGTYRVTPPAGQTVAVRVPVPGTASITLFGVRIPISQLVPWLMLMAAIAIMVIVVVVIIRRMSK